MSQSLITWNVPNFITVVLMVLLGAVLFAFVAKAANAGKSS